VKVGVVGVGLMGTQYARILSQTPNAQLVGVADIDSGRTSHLASELGVTPFEGAGEMLAAIPDVAAIVITTPESAHLGPAIAAAEAGKHLLVEKPLALTAAECQLIIDRCQRAGTILMVGHHSHFDPRFEELKQRIDAGTLGTLVHMHARRNLYTTSAQRIARRVPLSMWAGVHDIEIMLWYSGQRVSSVFAKAVTVEPGSAVQSDALVAVLCFESGLLGVLEYSWIAPPLQGNPRRFFFDLVGTNGFAEVDYGNGGLGIFTPTAATYPDMMFFPRVAGRLTGQYREQLLYFLDCIDRGAPPVITGPQAMHVVTVAEAIERSLADGREIRLDGLGPT
jgi:UDP-N-acetylglucosamine 3-dehydrogenase